MHLSSVIFDLDGTLLDTIEDLSDSMNDVLKKLGFPVHTISEYRLFVGEGMRTLVRRSIPSPAVESITSKAVSLMEHAYMLNYSSKTKPYPGITELLGSLSARGIKLAVLSNKPDKFTRRMVEELIPGKYFDLVLGGKKGIPLKPDPAGALLISGKFGIAPEEFIYVGDSGIDMRTAEAAGMFAVGALWGFRTRVELLKNGAKALISHPLELLRFFSIP
jgi:phosphoglycolate phosphatase